MNELEQTVDALRELMIDTVMRDLPGLSVKEQADAVARGIALMLSEGAYIDHGKLYFPRA